ncbi:MAG: hypothetical protein QM765_32100 [Myxococcales bacterium]
MHCCAPGQVTEAHRASTQTESFLQTWPCTQVPAPQTLLTQVPATQIWSEEQWAE